MSENTKLCPFCGEEILKVAKKCKHCKTWLIKKCPFCCEEIDVNTEICPHCNSSLKTDSSKSVKDKNIDSISDNWITILWKIGLAIIGAIVLMNLFPHAFDDKFIYTNPITGQEISIPATEELKSYKKPEIIPYKGYIIKYDASKTSPEQAVFVAANILFEYAYSQEELDKKVHQALYNK